ncbi:2-oxo-4-hydroxy-4-carboxy-5-ureidoimidazoline decarboxylase [Mycolicibacterium sp. CBMA 226]|uniref:2-oxo-4-hydroxy-4-carboxy-5-ureidoimidazoline decarboxylase n=1 Tax=Mycolicibacterium sp. CBMA 226 TaxID=2606611 RepID=UPI0012DE66E3|nr:2-oxo-4-hydroxy-4-carboxy-5-ureidoimidazoline decarboxylase [Mycolicibacterium sp. CBMA 226]MUL75487.1 2-oxo-4-hydroxy-4-carboxy-5-ureidoimidazoline decarboxylase [Mycolicibacterium sp. CBMA 226]
MDLQTFNSALPEEAEEVLRPCADIAPWLSAVVAARPYASLDELESTAARAADDWSVDNLDQALAQHPRIGERANGTSVESGLSRGEQPAMAGELAAAMARANADYEAKFGRIFLIRAKGRSAADIYAALQHRLSLGREEEAAIAIGQLREIALLRLTERVTP